ncbi:hypothetical protein F4814DRAFT_411776 [Daldinia grandis]|nr:hypothetical protein F4814DRAFT_411776 [Daldinia grandis]
MRLPSLGYCCSRDARCSFFLVFGFFSLGNCLLDPRDETACCDSIWDTMAASWLRCMFQTRTGGIGIRSLIVIVVSIRQHALRR